MLSPFRMSEGGLRVSRLCRTWLSWSGGIVDRNEVVEEGIILNMSEHGALVFSDSFPQLGENVLIQLAAYPIRLDRFDRRTTQSTKNVAIDFRAGLPRY